MKYKIEMMRFNDLKEKAIVNNFQRRLVWSNREKIEFIDTLKHGYPFGSILIYKYKDLDKFSIIDGLQRFSTIEDFNEKPHNYITDLEDFVTAIAERIIKDDMPKPTYINYKKHIEKGIYELFETSERSYNTLYLKLLESHLLKGYVESESEFLYEQQDKIVKHVNEYLDVNEIQIPCIEFTGDETELATVFQNLNRGGKKLSKYQVFSAQWSKYETKLNKDKYNIDILNIIIDRYVSLKDSRSVDILEFDEMTMRKERTINLSEFAYGLGRLIIDKMEVFWPASKSSNEDLANEIGYSTLGIVLSVSNNKLHDIPEHQEFFKDPLKIENMIEKIISEYVRVNTYFKRYLTIPGSNKERFESGAATNFQILSFFAALWVEKYTYDDSTGKVSENQGFRKSYDLILENLIHYFVYDIVTRRWTGTGDKKLNEIYIDKIIRYKRPLDEQELEDRILSWNDEILERGSIQFSSITKILYVIYISYHGSFHSRPSYDYEHIFPKAKFNQYYKSEVIPLGSLGNIMLLDNETNRSKQDNHILGNRQNISSLSSKFIEIHEYPNTNVLNTLNEDLRSDDFIKVKNEIRIRSKRIITSLVSNLKNPI